MRRKNIEMKSPLRIKDLEGKLGVSFKERIGIEGSRKELYDTDKMIALDMKKGECIALADSTGRFFELCRNERGRFSLNRLDEK